MNPPSIAANTSRRARAVEGAGDPLKVIGLMIAALTIAAPARAADPAPHYPSDTVLLLVAPWCAPCHAELARLDAIAAAARPHAVRVFMVADGAGARAMWQRVPEAYRWTPPDGEARRYRADAMGRTPGLPFSIATDARGRVCATHGGGLDAPRAARLAAAC